MVSRRYAVLTGDRTGEGVQNQYLSATDVALCQLLVIVVCIHLSEHVFVRLVSSRCRARPQLHVEEGQRVSLRPTQHLQLCSDLTAN